MRSIHSFLLVVLALVCSGCQFMEPAIPGSGTISSEDRDVGSFEAVSFSGGGRMSIQANADSSSCKVECDDNLLEFIETKVEDGKLVIRCTKSIEPSNELIVTLATPHLKKVGSAGSCDTTVNGLSEDSFSVSIAGSGDVICDGDVQKLSLDIAGSGSLEARKLSADNVDISIAGSGEANVNATTKLKVSIAGSGSVLYQGSPEVSKSVMGSGSVEKVND